MGSPQTQVNPRLETHCKLDISNILKCRIYLYNCNPCNRHIPATQLRKT